MSMASIIRGNIRPALFGFRKALTTMLYVGQAGFSSAVNSVELEGSKSLKYTHAITKKIPTSFTGESLRVDLSSDIDYSRAVQQMKRYEEILKKCGLKVITLPADERYPDSVFVEDTAVVIGPRACLTRPGHASRRGEVMATRDGLQKLGLEIVEFEDPSAYLDGGDVLFTGQEILVGQSFRTNKAAVKCLQSAFPEIPVTPIPVPEGTLHLKCRAAVVGDVILVGGDKAGQEVMKNLKSNVQGNYTFQPLSGGLAANVILINGRLVIKSEREIGPEDYKILTSDLNVPCIEAEFDEIYKANGSLSCCSILVKLPQNSFGFANE